MSRHPCRGAVRLLAVFWAAAQCSAAAGPSRDQGDVLDQLLGLIGRSVGQATEPLIAELNSQRQLLSDIASKLNGLNSRMDVLESRLESLDSEQESRLESLGSGQESRLASLQSELESLGSGQESRLAFLQLGLESWLANFSAALASKSQCVADPNSLPRDCSDLLPSSPSGIYEVRLDPGHSNLVKVFCDMDTDGGGWTVFQRRADILPRQDFFRSWAEYKAGFGELQAEFWWRLDKLWQMTAPLGRRYELRVDLEDFDGERRYAVYRVFRISSESQGYRLMVGDYTGDAGDSLGYHNGQLFSTKDKDQGVGSGNCAVLRKGAWWHKNCYQSNLNGEYRVGKIDEGVYGIAWKTWKGFRYSLKATEMKIRPITAA